MRKGIALAVLACVCLPAIALSEVVVRVPTVELMTSPVEQTGEFFVYLDVVNEDPAPLLNNFSLEIVYPEAAAAGITLDDVLPPSEYASDYVLPSALNPANLIPPTEVRPDASSVRFGHQALKFGMFGAEYGADPLVDGRVFGKIQFTVPAGAEPGVYPVTIVDLASDGNPTGWSSLQFTDNGVDFTRIPFAPVPGAIVIQQIPEPATTVMLLSMVASLGFWFYRRRKAA